MTTQDEYDDFKERHAKILNKMESQALSIFLDYLIDLEKLGLDSDNSLQIVQGIFNNPFEPDY
jgi:hypothetical protein